MVELLILATTFAVAAWAAGARVHRRHAAARALDAYARSRGLRFVPAPDAPRGASPSIVADQDGGPPFTIDLYRLGELRLAGACLVVEAPLTSRVGAGLRGGLLGVPLRAAELLEPLVLELHELLERKL